MKIIIAFICGLIAGFIFVQFNGFEAKTFTKTEFIRDTVLIYKPSNPVVLKEIVPKIIYRKDTVVVTKSFEARIDTVVKLDTIMLSYKFPENRFSYVLKPKVDTLSQIIRIVFPRNNCDCKSKWLIAGLGLTAGVILSNLSK